MGVHLQSSGLVGRDVGASPVLPARNRGLGSVQDLAESPMVQRLQGGPPHSTPSGENDTLHQLSDMITQLGSQIGESIAASLISSGAIANSNQTNAAHTRPLSLMLMWVQSVIIHISMLL